MGNRNRLVQLFYNLLDNAREAIIRHRSQASQPWEARIAIDAHLTGATLILTVADTGDGIPGHLQDRIFEPFFTTKPAGQGKGLGLSISHQIIRDMGGSIAVESSLAEGTVVTLAFPVIAR